MHAFTVTSRLSSFALTAALALSLGCGPGSNVSNEENARRAYFGLDRAVERGINLGLQGFSMAQSANIDPQTGMGEVSGTLVVGGQASGGSSDNRELRLTTAYTMYQDRVPGDGDGGDVASRITYDTPAGALPTLTISLRGIPSGTFTGTLTGTVNMSGDLQGAVTLNLTMMGRTEAVPGAMNQLRRVAGSTTITGTATSSYGTYMVNVTR